MTSPQVVPIDISEYTMTNRVATLVDFFCDMWQQTDHVPFAPGTLFSKCEQKKRERFFKQFVNRLENENKSTIQLDDEATHERIFKHVRLFFESALKFSPAQVDLLLSQGFKASTKEFVRVAKQFDPTLSYTDLFQACRNVWIMNGLQLMLGLPIEFTPAIFAYSMLYPYTDNYLDDPAISAEHKRDFNRRFAQRLAGESVMATNDHERVIFVLVEMIEGQFNRLVYPDVYLSLLAIHRAQTLSVGLVGCDETVSSRRVMEISFDKGGTSVLADGYLVAGELTPDQERFLFGYGIYLQLLDDLQDVNEDLENGQQTLYAMEIAKGPLDEMTWRTLDFGDRVMGDITGFYGTGCRQYVSIMQQSIPLMLLEAVALAPDYFTSNCLQTLESFSPFRFLFIREMKQRHAKHYMSMFGKTV